MPSCPQPTAIFVPEDIEIGIIWYTFSGGLINTHPGLTIFFL